MLKKDPNVAFKIQTISKRQNSANEFSFFFGGQSDIVGAIWKKRFCPLMFYFSITQQRIKENM